jgi:chromosome transmission fidelity protein 4
MIALVFTLFLSEILTIARDSWTKASAFSNSSSTGPIYALALSPNGVYLASSTNKDVHVWSTQTRRLLFTYVLYVLPVD